MSPSAEPLFPPRGERDYDASAVETFPWPVVVGYEYVHHWMDRGQAVHAAWQLKDVWEGLLKFLATLAVADHLAAAPAGDPRTRKLLDQLLKKGGLTDGDWAKLLEMALKDGPLPNARVPQLSPLLFQAGKRQPLYHLFTGDKDDVSRDNFIAWRNLCFGHGVFRKDLQSYADESLYWLRRLHEAFDLCRSMLQSLALESDGPKGEILTWGEKGPLPFYHDHQPAATGPLLPPVRVRTPGGEALVLTPLLSVQLCAVCGQWTAFYLDKYDRDKHRAQFLDFIEGHSNDHKDLEPLRTWTALLTTAKGQGAAAAPPDLGERREPDPERFRDFQHEFEPPAYLARQVADFLRAHDRGVLLLTGPGGVGKSWATQGLDQAAMLPAALGRAVPLLDVSMHGPTAPRASDVRTALAERARRVKRWQVPAWPDGPDPRTRFAGWLAALMRANGLGELLVALDGLDDLPADSDVPDLWPPADALPPGCYLVLSTRPRMRAATEDGLRRVRSLPDYFCELRVGPDEPAHRGVLRSYAAKRLARPRPDGQGPLPASWAEPLIDQAEGSFLYVFHYCRALHFGVYADLAQLPPPAAYYPAFFEHLRGRVGPELFHRDYVWALALIAVAREPVGLTHLEAWGLDRSRLIVVLDDLADLLRGRREPWDAETLYNLGHDAVRQFLTEDKAWKSRLAAADRRLAELAVRRFGNDWSAVDPFDPVESYLLFHLLDHAKQQEQHECLLASADLAAACLGHGIALWNMKEFEAALLACNMAVSLREDQVERQGRQELRHDLAAAYINRGNVLSRMGYLEEGLSDYGACITLYERLVNGEGRHGLRHDMAASYLNRGNALNLAGRLTEALVDYGRSIALYEVLVNSEGRHELRRDLAAAYTNRGVALHSLGRFDETLSDHGAGIALREEFGELRNEQAAAYMNRGVVLQDLGRLDEALSDYGACITLYEHLVNDEGHRELRDGMAASYLNRANALSALGRLNQALTDYGVCITLVETLVHGEGRRDLRKELARSYLNRGNVLQKLRRFDEALSDYRTCIALLESLINREGHSELRNDLAMAYLNRGNLLYLSGRLEQAMSDCTAGIALLEALVNCEGRRELAGDLGWGYGAKAWLLLTLGQREDARSLAERAVRILRAEVSRTERAHLREALGFAEGVLREASKPLSS
jgi:tetratricopeptide (TPR) repeat protein